MSSSLSSRVSMRWMSLLAGGLLFTSVAIAGSEPAASCDEPEAKVADTKTAEPAPPKPEGAAAPKAEKEKIRVYTNADLMKLEPIPSQSAPISASGSGPAARPQEESWESIIAFIERERANEERRRDREMTYQAMADAEAQRQREYDYYDQNYYLPFAYHGFFPGFCHNGSCPQPVPQPTNTFLPLQQRGIRTATDLFNESVHNSNVRRANFP